MNSNLKKSITYNTLEYNIIINQINDIYQYIFIDNDKKIKKLI